MPKQHDDQAQAGAEDGFETLQLGRLETLRGAAESLLAQERRQRLTAEALLECLAIVTDEGSFAEQCRRLFAALQRVIAIDHALVMLRSGPSTLASTVSLPPGEPREIEACPILQRLLRGPGRLPPAQESDDAMTVARHLLAPDLTGAYLGALPVGREVAVLLIATRQGEGYSPDDVALLNRVQSVMQGLYRRERQRDTALHQARLASLGESMATMLHQLAQPLNALLLSAQTASRGLERGGDIQVAAKGLKRQEDLARRMGALLRATQVWVRPHDWKEVSALLRAGNCSLSELIESARTLFEHRLQGDQVTLRLRLDDLAQRVAVHPLALEQVLSNLLKNALGSIREARRKGDDGRAHWVEIASAPHPTLDDFLLVSIADSGVGFPRELLDIGPADWLSYKAPGEGSGLGLALSDRLVSEMGGELLLSATGGGGALVVLVLPRTGPAGPADTQSTAADTAGEAAS